MIISVQFLLNWFHKFSFSNLTLIFVFDLPPDIGGGPPNPAKLGAPFPGLRKYSGKLGARAWAPAIPPEKNKIK